MRKIIRRIEREAHARAIDPPARVEKAAQQNAFIFQQLITQREIVTNHSTLRLYVRIVKTLAGNVEVERPHFSVSREPYPWQTQKWPRPSSPPLVYEYILPEDQQKTTEMVKIIASKYGLEVEVIDVARKNFLSTLIQRKRKKIGIFPTLIAGSGQKAEGEITEKQVESLLSQMARARKNTQSLMASRIH